MPLRARVTALEYTGASQTTSSANPFVSVALLLELHKEPSLMLTKLEVATSSSSVLLPSSSWCQGSLLRGVTSLNLDQWTPQLQRRRQILNFQLVMSVFSLSGDGGSVTNRTRPLCLRVNSSEKWTPAGWIFFPPFQERTSDSESNSAHPHLPSASPQGGAFSGLPLYSSGSQHGQDDGKAPVSYKDEDQLTAHRGPAVEERTNQLIAGNSHVHSEKKSNLDYAADEQNYQQINGKSHTESNLLTPEDSLENDVYDDNGDLMMDDSAEFYGESNQLSSRGGGGGGDGGRVVQRIRRQEQHVSNGLLDLGGNMPGARILAMRLVETSNRLSYTDDGRITVLEGMQVTLDIIGLNMDNETVIKFTTSRQEFGEPCGYQYERHTQTVPFNINNYQDGQGRVVIPADSFKFYAGENVYYACVRNPYTQEFVHQGKKPQLQLEVYSLLLPVWLMAILIVILLGLSGLFSGLNLGLMSLDQTELRIVMNTGSDTEKNYAKAIMPIRGMGNFLLCSILLGNVLVNNTLTIILDTLTGGGGIVAVIGATLSIVIFGEIIPQAICSRHGLAVGAKTIWLTKFFMMVTSPLAFPLSKILDKILGAEIGTVYNRERLMELIKVTDQYTDLEKDEVNIVTGALVLKRKCVKDVMTHLDDCYMLPIETVLNFETISELKDQGYSRIPVYKGERSNVVHILFARDLLFIDPDDNKPLEEVCKFYKNDVNFVYQDTILTDMFDEFKSGDKGHMALVQEVNTEGEGDPFYETVGLVTLEDIIEEIIQQEIVDETDVVIDNKTKKKRKRERQIKDAEFKMFLDRKNYQRVIITPQVSLAVYQFLTTWVKAFSSEVITTRVMQKLLNLDVYRELKLKTKKYDSKLKGEDPNDREGMLMMKGKPCDYFLLIVEGRVEVTIGKEEHKFIEGPFTTFGEQMLEQVYLDTTGVGSRRSGSADGGLASIGRSAPWLPDYTLRAITDIVYLKIRRNTYMVALKASRMNNMNSEIGDKELDIALERVTEDDNDGGDDFERTPSFRSPDKSFEGGLSLGEVAAGVINSRHCTPTEFRRSSLNLVKCKQQHQSQGGGGGSMSVRGMLGGKSSTSVHTKLKEDFWDGGQSNDDFSDKGIQLNFNSGSKKCESSPGGGPLSLPLNKRMELREMQQQTRSEDGCSTNRTLDHGVDNGAMTAVRCGGSTVITVRGSSDPHLRVNGGGGGAEYLQGGGAERPHSTSPNDRTSLLQSENPEGKVEPWLEAPPTCAII